MRRARRVSAFAPRRRASTRSRAPMSPRSSRRSRSSVCSARVGRVADSTRRRQRVHDELRARRGRAARSQSVVPRRSDAARQRQPASRRASSTRCSRRTRRPTATGVTAAIRGQVWRLIHVDLSGDSLERLAGFYRPRYQTRSELFVKTNLLRPFPTGDFGIMVVGRSRVPIGRALSASATSDAARPCRATARSRRCSKFGFSARPSRGSSGISWASATRRCRSSSCRGRRTSTAYGGSSAIDKCRCHSVG